MMQLSKILWSLWCVTLPAVIHASVMRVAPSKHAAMPLLLIYTNQDKSMPDVVNAMAKDLEFKGQFAVTARESNSKLSKKEIREWHKKGYLIAVFLESDARAITWRLYNTDNANMIDGKKYTKQGANPRGWAHAVADKVWHAVTGQDGFFSTKIAYCQERQEMSPQGIPVRCKDIYVCDYDGSHTSCMVQSSQTHVAPRWNGDAHKPLLFCSEHTDANVRLLAVDMEKNQKIVSNFDGINMLPSFSQDGKKAVYCASRGDGACQIYQFSEGGHLERLIHNQGNNISPVFSKDTQTVYFCSDYQTGYPAIYSYHIPTKAIERITESGYCSAPAYSASKDMLAYTKLVQGVGQIFTYSIANKQHKQITHDASHKDECCWSPCGTMLLFSRKAGKKSCLVMKDIHTNVERAISDTNYSCSYPAWSRAYKAFPVC